MAAEFMIHGSVKTEVGDSDRHSALAVRPWFLLGSRWPYSGDGAQMVVAAVFRLLLMHDESGMLRRPPVAGLGQAV